jgi:hypothetical protein
LLVTGAFAIRPALQARRIQDQSHTVILKPSQRPEAPRRKIEASARHDRNAILDSCGRTHTASSTSCSSIGLWSRDRSHFEIGDHGDRRGCATASCSHPTVGPEGDGIGRFGPHAGSVRPCPGCPIVDPMAPARTTRRPCTDLDPRSGAWRDVAPSLRHPSSCPLRSVSQPRSHRGRSPKSSADARDHSARSRRAPARRNRSEAVVVSSPRAPDSSNSCMNRVRPAALSVGLWGDVRGRRVSGWPCACVWEGCRVIADPFRIRKVGRARPAAIMALADPC